MRFLFLISFALFAYSNLNSQVAFVVDSNGQNVRSNNLYLFDGAAHCNFEGSGHYRIHDTTAHPFPIANGILESAVDSIYYYGLQDDTVLHRYRSDSAKWYTYSGVEAYRPVVHKGDEYFIEIVRSPQGIVDAWRLNKIVNNQIIFGPNNPLGDFHPASWHKSIIYRNSYRTGGLHSNGSHLVFAGVRQVNTNQANEHYELIVSEIKGLGQFDTLQVIRPLTDNFVPVVEPLGLVGDSILYFHIKEIPNFNFGLNAPMRFIASLNLRNGSYKRQNPHPHHYAGCKAGVIYWNNYMSDTLLEQSYLFSDLNASLPAMINYRVIGQDDSGFVYFQAMNKSLDIWRSNIKKTERFHYDQAGSNAQQYLGHYAGMVQDSLFALVYNKNGDVQLLIKNIHTRKERHYDLADSLSGFRLEYRVRNMVFAHAENALYFIQSRNNSFIGSIVRCALDSLQQIQNPSGIKETMLELTVFPNPIEDFIYIKSDTPPENIVLSDLSGKLFKADITFDDKLCAIQCKALSPGVYLIHFTLDGYPSSHRIVKR